MTDLFDAKLYELCPEPMRKLPKVRALSWAFENAAKRIEGYVKRSMVNVDIDSLDMEVVDALAAEIGAPYYDDTADEKTRRQTLKDAILNNMQVGTPAAVKRMVDTVFGTGDVIEWFENGMDPYLFEIETSAQFAPGTLEQLEQIVRSVKNVRSALASVTGVREIEADWKHGIAGGYDSRETLLNDVNIDETGEPYQTAEYMALCDVSELSEDIAVFKDKHEANLKLPIYAAAIGAQDTLTVLVGSPLESELTGSYRAKHGMSQDTRTVLAEEA